MKLLRKCFATALLCLLTASARADGFSFETIEQAATRSTDLSRQILVMIFGDVVTNPLSTDASLVGQIFFIFNGVVACVACFWFMGLTLKHIVKAGQAGKVFSGGASMMGPVSTLAGFLSLVPTVSGWSLSQLTFLWAASIMGVGGANVVTDGIVDMMAKGYSLVVQPVTPQTVSTARAIYEMNLCMYSLNTDLATLYSRYGQGGTPMMAIKALPDGFEISNGNALCGSARLPQSLPDPSVNWAFPAPVNVDPILSAQRSAMNEMQNTLSQSASRFVSTLVSKQDTGSGSLPDAETDIQKAARAYEDRINQTLKVQGQDNQLVTVLSAQLKKYGWLSLGSWYQTFATANNKVNDAVQLKPAVTGMSGLGDLGTQDLYASVITAYQAQLQNSKYTPPLGTIGTQDIQQTQDATDPNAVFVGIFGSTILHWTNNIATSGFGTLSDGNTQMNPLLKMKAIGDYTLDGAEASLAIFTASKILAETTTKGLWGKVASAFSFNATVGIRAVLDAFTPIIYFVLLLLFTTGFSLSIFLPLIPFIYWMAGAANWIVSVLVGVTGGTLFSATHIGTENEPGHRSTYGYIFLIDVMIRPMLMVLGFIFASLTIVAIGTLLDLLFGPAIANVQASSITGVVTMVGLLLAYARLCTSTVSRVFSLQVTMPDYVISWLGGREAANILGNVVDSTKSIFAGFSHGVQHAPGLKTNTPVSSQSPEGDGIK
ncbi:DotA/TraY family protein [Klebsiella michiganensis]|uniref:DotA/TraY family protein n=1 Tax=Klebsiella michiganensis TaxID=1134687 RepID=UPI003F50961B